MAITSNTGLGTVIDLLLDMFLIGSRLSLPRCPTGLSGERPCPTCSYIKALHPGDCDGRWVIGFTSGMTTGYGGRISTKTCFTKDLMMRGFNGPDDRLWAPEPSMILLRPSLKPPLVFLCVPRLSSTLLWPQSIPRVRFRTLSLHH